MNRKVVSRGILRWLAALLCLCLAMSVAAKGKKGKKEKAPEKPAPVEPVWPSPLDPGKIDPVFKELPFNDSQEKFVFVFRSRLADQLKPVLRATLDARERDVLNAKMDKTMEDVEKSYTEFIGQQTGYSVSVVSDEYQDKAGESLYKYAYSENTAYVFFSGKTLWKMQICSESNRDIASLLVALASLYGDPKDVQFEDEEKTKPVLAMWKDTTFELTVAPPRGIYSCSRLTWTYLPLKETVDQRRGAAAAAQGTGSPGDSIIDQVTEEGPKDKEDPVDKLLKKKQEEK